MNVVESNNSSEYRDPSQDFSDYTKAILFLLGKWLSNTFVLVDFIFLLIGLFIYRELLLPPEFYLLLLFLGLVTAAIKIVKEEIITSPRLFVSINPENIELLVEDDYYPIRWEALGRGHSLVTRYKVFITNFGLAASFPYITVSNSKMDNNSFGITLGKGTSRSDGEFSTRITYLNSGMLMRDESIHIATLKFYVTENSQVELGIFFELPITFGALNSREKEIKSKFKYIESN